MESLGKCEAILAASQLIRRLALESERPLRLLELGCGEGQVLGTLADAHAGVIDLRRSVGVDYNPQALARCRHDYPRLRWVEGDFTDARLLAGLGQFDLELLVNSLHEVFSAVYSPELGEVDTPAAKLQVEQTLRVTLNCLAPGGYLLLFDGVEPPGDPRQELQVHFLSAQVRLEFEQFARGYRPYHVAYHEASRPGWVELSRRDFTRYITKSIFLGKPLWQTERLESYQYFTEGEFRETLARLGLDLEKLEVLTVNGDKWRSRVEVEPSEAEFPQEHILILARK